MEPRIQYAHTADGVSIAFSTLGEGMPFVQTPVAICGVLQVEWQIPQIRAWDERVARKRMLVKYDSRGTGLSERGPTDYSLDIMVRDLEAVVDHLDLPRFALMGTVVFGPAAIAYAARHPERVSHLILWCTYARSLDFQTPQMRSMNQLAEDDWNLFTEAVCHWFTGFSTGEAPRQLAAMWRKSITQEEYLTATRSLVNTDVKALLPEVRAPTLVLHRRQLPMLSVDAGTDLASEIPGAQLGVVEGSSGGYAFEDQQEVLNAIVEFLGEGEESAAGAAPSGLVTILFTDMESSAALRQRLGDARAQELVRTHNSIVRQALTAHAGREIKHTGDGIMSSFPTASSALECAIAIQRGIAAHVQEHPEAPLGVYIGLNAGEPIAEDKDLFGTSVDLAKRICDHAQPGQILVSDVVRQLAAGKSFLFADCGETEMRGFEDPVRLYEVRWQEG
jgi:class 3 adenylate cyclase/pimeloyl-ACP methyl ester carboxylesterase